MMADSAAMAMLSSSWGTTAHPGAGPGIMASSTTNGRGANRSMVLPLTEDEEKQPAQDGDEDHPAHHGDQLHGVRRLRLGFRRVIVLDDLVDDGRPAEGLLHSV